MHHINKVFKGKKNIDGACIAPKTLKIVYDDIYISSNTMEHVSVTMSVLCLHLKKRRKNETIQFVSLRKPIVKWNVSDTSHRKSFPYTEELYFLAVFSDTFGKN